MRTSGVSGLWTLEPCLFCPTFLQAAAAAAILAVFSWQRLFVFQCFLRIWTLERCDLHRGEREREGSESQTDLTQGRPHETRCVSTSCSWPLCMKKPTPIMRLWNQSFDWRWSWSEFFHNMKFICLRAMACEHGLIELFMRELVNCMRVSVCAFLCAFCGVCTYVLYKRVLHTSHTQTCMPASI